MGRLRLIQIVVVVLALFCLCVPALATGVDNVIHVSYNGDYVPDDSQPQFEIQPINGKIFLRLVPQGAPISGAYVVLEAPNTYLRTFDYAGMSVIPIVGTAQSTDDGTNKKIRIDLSDVDATTSATINYTSRFYNKVSPDGYTLPVRATIYNADGTVLTQSNFDPAHHLVYKPAFFSKHLLTNDFQTIANNSSDTQYIYMGPLLSLPDGRAYVDPDRAENVPYLFSIHSRYHGYVEDNLNLPSYNQIVITEKPPLYTDYTGAQRRAVFDTTLSPGWMANADGSYSKTYVTDGASTAETKMEADKVFLRFPGMLTALPIYNAADAKLSPINTEPERDFTLSDTIKVNANGDIAGGTVMSKFYPSSAHIHDGAIYDDVTYKIIENRWTVPIVNSYRVPMNNLVIEDIMPQEETRLINYVAFPNAFLKANISRVEYTTWHGETGTVDLAGFIYGNPSRIPLSKDIEYKTIRVVFNPSYTLAPGASITVTFYSRLRKEAVGAYQVNYIDNPVLLPGQASRDIYNNVKLTGKLADASATAFEYHSSAFYTILPMEGKEKLWIFKGPFFRPGVPAATHQAGDKLRFWLMFYGDISYNRPFNNLTLVDIFPKGFTIDGVVDDADGATVDTWFVEDMPGTDFQKLTIKFADNIWIFADQGVYPKFGVKIDGTVNDLSKPGFNYDYGYMSADNIQEADGVQLMQPLKDTRDVDGDGDTEEFVLMTPSYYIYNPNKTVSISERVRHPGGIWEYDITAEFGEEYQYKISAFNGNSNAVSDLYIYSMLPTEGDYLGSGFTPTLINASIAEPYDKSFTILYTTRPLSGTDAAADALAAGWVPKSQIQDMSLVTGVKAQLNPGASLPSLAAADLILTMKAPVDAMYSGKTAIELAAGFTTVFDQVIYTGSVFVRLPEVETVSFHAKKSWELPAGKEAAPYTLQLLQDGKPYLEQVALGADAAGHVWEQLPLMNHTVEPSAPYVYSVKESVIPKGFTASYGTVVPQPYSFTQEVVNSVPAPASWNAISVPLDVVKELKNQSMQGGEFTFLLKDAAGNLLERKQNEADGKVAFMPRRFSREGIYLYTVMEEAGNLEGITYDKTVYTIRVETRAKNGKLSADVTVLKDNKLIAGPAKFVNYAALPPTGDSTAVLIALITLAGFAFLFAASRRKSRG